MDLLLFINIYCITIHHLVMSCACFFAFRYPALQNQQLARDAEQRDVAPGEWRHGLNLLNTIEVAGPNSANRDGKKQRNLLKHWCSSPAGSVEWQDRMV